MNKLKCNKWWNINLSLLKHEPNSAIKCGFGYRCWIMHREYYDEYGQVYYAQVIIRIG